MLGSIADSLEVLDCPLDDADPVVTVAEYRWHVLNQQEARTDDLRRSNHPQVQSVLLIDSTRVVVQIAVSLAGWSAHQQIDIRHRCGDALLDECRRIAQRSSKNASTGAVSIRSANAKFLW